MADKMVGGLFFVQFLERSHRTGWPTHGTVFWTTYEAEVPASLEDAVSVVINHHRVTYYGKSLIINETFDPMGYNVKVIRILGNRAEDVTKAVLVGVGKRLTEDGEDWPWWLEDLKPAGWQ